MPPRTLLAVPNVSEGRQMPRRSRRSRARSRPGPNAMRRTVRLLDVHSDADHHRSVFTFAGGHGQLAAALLGSPRRPCSGSTSTRRAATGQHPHVGALDVVPLVYLRREDRGAACAEALVVAERIGTELDMPVFLYGELDGDAHAAGPHPRRAAPRRRSTRSPSASPRPPVSAEALRPDFGPPRLAPDARAPRSSPRARRSSPSTSQLRVAGDRRRRASDRGARPGGRRARACPGCGRSASSCAAASRRSR